MIVKYFIKGSIINILFFNLRVVSFFYRYLRINYLYCYLVFCKKLFYIFYNIMFC